MAGMIGWCNGSIKRKMLYFGDGMNNKAELLGLLTGLQTVKNLGFFNLDIELDSKLIIKWLIDG